MTDGPGRLVGLVGREEPLSRIRAAAARTADGVRSLVLVAGEAGIGKTALVRVATQDLPVVGWGTCIDEAGAPGYWPWSRALDQLARRIGVPEAVAAAGDDAPLLATIASVFGAGRTGQAPSARDRVLLMDAVGRWLERVAPADPVAVVLDDLQWADESSLALLEFVARSPGPARLCVIGCYRHDEVPRALRGRLARLSAPAEHVQLRGLDRDAVATLVEAATGVATEAAVDECYRRAGGHPVFTRELALLAATDHSAHVPLAVREAIDQRIRRLPDSARRALAMAAVAGNEVYRSVVARALGQDPIAVDAALAPAVDAGMVALDDGGLLRFAHDLYRETILATPDHDRPALHRDLGRALEHRADHGGEVGLADLARHFAAAVPVDGATRAAKWALEAAAADRRSLAFTEAAAHLRRWRAAVADAGAEVTDGLIVEVLLAEADALARAGSVVAARGLLRTARDVAIRSGAGDALARIALAVTDLGAQFAARRDDVLRELDEALDAVAGVDAVLEARVTAALARELQHSVASERPRAGPLSERALALGRAAGDADTLVACLLARHDVLWTPGSAPARADVAHEIVAAASAVGDDERRAEGLLLLANALLEMGSAAFLPALESSLEVLGRLGQPRHRYTVETRRAALALLHGELDEAAELIDRAAALGVRIREPDTENVRMSQRLELVRSRGQAPELEAFAAAAVAHWTGAPVHAHAVAAGFLARAGKVDAARRHVGTVVDLGTWRADRSYLWSVFVRELAVAAIALDDRDLCRLLFDELTALTSTCGVNGAVVAFAGSHAHTAALLAGALGSDAARLWQDTVDTYSRLGAAGWLAEATARRTPRRPPGERSLRRAGRSWHVVFHDERATVPHAKGLADLAALLAQPDKDVPALVLYGSDDRSGPAGAVADREALDAYRRRLRELEEDLDEAGADHDDGRVERLEAEREALLRELGSVTALHRGTRVFANYPAERARKAVAARVRDAIRRLSADAPALAAHLDGAVVTGMSCRYRGDGGPPWEVVDDPRRSAGR